MHLSDEGLAARQSDPSLRSARFDASLDFLDLGSLFSLCLASQIMFVDTSHG
jgi:hypothetical protein